MNKELYALLMSYQDRELDDEFINKALDIILDKEKSLTVYVSGLSILNEGGIEERPSFNDGTLKKMIVSGSYSLTEHSITIFKNNIINHSRFENKKAAALVTLQHELEHARQLQELHQGHSNIESMIIKYSLIPYAIRNGLGEYLPLDKHDADDLDFRKRLNQDIDPGERLAEIKACRFLVNLLKNQRYSQDLLDARIELYLAYISGYQDNGAYLDPPAYEFLLRLGLYHEYYLFKKFVTDQHYSYDTRLMYGLPLTYREAEEKVLQKVRLQKRRMTVEEQQMRQPK